MCWMSEFIEVYVFGSKSIHILPVSFTDELDLFMMHKTTFLVGDSGGVDLAVQKYLAEKEYEKVIIYYATLTEEFYIKDTPCHNIGNWQTKAVDCTDDPDLDDVPFDENRDMAMILRCDKAICLWDEGSIDTKQNLIDLKRKDLQPKVFSAKGDCISGGVTEMVGTWYYDKKDRQLHTCAVPLVDAENNCNYLSYGHWDIPSSITAKEEKYGFNGKECYRLNTSIISGEVRYNIREEKYELMMHSQYDESFYDKHGNRTALEELIIPAFGIGNSRYVKLYSPEITVLSTKDFLAQIDRGHPFNKCAVIIFYDHDKPIDPSMLPCAKVLQYNLPDLDYADLESFGYTYDTFWPELEQDVYHFEKPLICVSEHGMSRSAAVAAALMEYRHGNGIRYFADYKYSPNKLIYHKLLEKLNQIDSVNLKMWPDWMD